MPRAIRHIALAGLLLAALAPPAWGLPGRSQGELGVAATLNLWLARLAHLVGVGQEGRQTIDPDGVAATPPSSSGGAIEPGQDEDGRQAIDPNGSPG